MTDALHSMEAWKLFPNHPDAPKSPCCDARTQLMSRRITTRIEAIIYCCLKCDKVHVDNYPFPS